MLKVNFTLTSYSCTSILKFLIVIIYKKIPLYSGTGVYKLMLLLIVFTNNIAATGVTILSSIESARSCVTNLSFNTLWSPA